MWYWTYFIIRMVRAKANEMGYTLNEHGIHPFADGEKKEMDPKEYKSFLKKQVRF